jgi:nucleotide-binding universal stress UspA family protein
MHLSVTLGQLTDSKTRLMHVVEYPPIDLASSAGALEEESQARLRNEAESALYEQLAGTDHRTLTYGVLPQIEDGPVDLAILRAIDQFSIDLVVLALSNRSGIPGQLGRTAEALLPRISCGVLAIKDREFPSPVSL